MSRSRLFSPVPLRENAELKLGDEQAHYVGRVLRLRPGDAVTVFDGSGGEYSAIVGKDSKQEMRLSIGKHHSRNTESPLKIRLVQGISRGDRMDTVVQKATELGVHRISPVITDHSVVRLPPDRAAKRHLHWQKIARSACEQCERNIIPVIDAAQPLVDWFADNVGSDKLLIILRPDAQIALPAIVPQDNEITILIGPEGGFSEAEYERAKAAGLRAAKLGPRILRTETAALAALSIAQATWGDYRAPDRSAGPA